MSSENVDDTVIPGGNIVDRFKKDPHNRIRGSTLTSDDIYNADDDYGMLEQGKRAGYKTNVVGDDTINYAKKLINEIDQGHQKMEIIKVIREKQLMTQLRKDKLSRTDIRALNDIIKNDYWIELLNNTHNIQDSLKILIKNEMLKRKRGLIYPFRMSLAVANTSFTRLNFLEGPTYSVDNIPTGADTSFPMRKLRVLRVFNEGTGRLIMGLNIEDPLYSKISIPNGKDHTFESATPIYENMYIKALDANTVVNIIGEI